MRCLSERIVGLLGTSPAMAQFEGWVIARTERVRRAAAAGQPGLHLELERLRAELMALRTLEPLAVRQSKVLWLEGLIALIAEVASDGPGDLQACA